MSYVFNWGLVSVGSVRAHVMSLASVLQTALSGMSAASTTLDVVSNNLANSRTAGFKAGRPAFAAQAPATHYAGSAPSASNGGSNPLQVGTGVRTVAIRTDFSQGPIITSANALDLALEGDGLFIVEGPAGEPSFVRAGDFQLNVSGEIVTPSGQRVLGYAVDEQFQIDGSRLAPLSIALGSTTTGADGQAATLTGFSAAADGRIEGQFSNGADRTLGQFRIARFANPSGLEAGGNGMFRAGANSGLPVESNPGSDGAATVLGGALELSNTDVGRNVVDLVLASNQFAANSLVFRSADDMLDELVSLGRHDD